MKALYFDGSLSIKEMPDPVPARGEALIQVLAAGICNTDLEITQGYMGFNGILGHEFIGLVVECDNPFLRGKRVVGEINCPCRNCRYCRMEMTRHCVERTVLGIQGRHGAFAEYLCLPEENLHLVPDSIQDETATFTEPLAAAFRIVEQLSPSSEDKILVLGDGKLAQLITQTLWLYSKNTICLGKHPWKMELLRNFGITAVPFEKYKGESADIVVEATGKSDGLTHALQLIRPEGSVILKTTCYEGSPLSSVSAVVNEVKILGSRCGPFRPALEALALGTVEVRPMISEAYALSDGVRAFSRAKCPDVMKVLLHMR
ncbi:MAG TPA: alcohol dehydrogenase catalytic domain-containing protein [Candidatus Hydrogenedentes bacterium]|nr:MAG: 2-deoxy-scyllo-inosamine dehydrogenase [Candidatus Hydrogenedentes bacterium ADurb.Bin170]HNZ47375.1 alcohol dehydrogenase catalytic domain-containing protein [Candidatus Hydrogenedentota bacterium]HOM48732.1 alcohol dehydrogenase catalytic domain-containing protein [Candidatus Hydrogenedentota bacterium]HPX85455.1 alcohol dehydrogenase catalytic domain-containing protein [Candidatus Hydrogenedentota bacterium]HQB03956.1 alcohol dehydrogenase catalytic domain-containing protein [Candida